MINEKLGIDGVDIFQELAKWFDVDISEINEVYFGSESVGFFDALLFPVILILQIFGYKCMSNKMISLPMSKLIKSAEVDKWNGRTIRPLNTLKLCDEQQQVAVVCSRRYKK